MSSKALKGLTIKIGGDTTNLTKALDSVETKGRSLSGELKQINDLLKLDPSNTELLAQKQSVLADAISNTEKKLDTLRQAEKQVQEQFERGEATEAQVRALRREIIDTTSRLERYKKAAKETEDAEKGLADGAEQVAKEMDNQADKTREAEKAAEDMDDVAGDLAKGGLAAMTAAATATVAAIVAMAEESREYRAEMAKLDAAYKSSGHSASTATKTYKTLQSVIGETDQSVEAAQQIALLAESEEDAAKWGDLAAGVIGRFGDALQPETFFEAANETLKLNQATGAYTQMLEGCGRDVDVFNAGLDACTTEQEKQAYMLEVTQQLLGAAAERYRETNAEVIRANESTEKLNESTARIGEVVEPAVTDLKELGASLLDDVEEPLEHAAEFVRKDVIPAIKNLSTGVKNNMPLIKGGVVGATTALVALRVATVSYTVAQKGATAAIKGTAIAQKALNLAQAASPMGLVAVGVTAVAAALIAYTAATKQAKKPVAVLTEEEKALAKAAREAAEAFEAQKTATEEAFGNINAEMDYVQRLADELDTLADASGRVKETDEARAEFILNELNKALGTEYEMVDGLIKHYGTLKGSIDEVIKSKTASLLIEEMSDDYVTAIQNQAAAKEALASAEDAYTAARAKANEVGAKLGNARYVNMKNPGYHSQSYIDKLEEEWRALDAVADDLKVAFDDAKTVHDGYQADILQYTAAQTAYLSGDYQHAVDLLTDYDKLLDQYATLPTDVAENLLKLQAEASEAKKIADETKAAFEAGDKNVTQEMVDEAQASYEAIYSEFKNAYADAFSVSEDIVAGLIAGLTAGEARIAEAGEKAGNSAIAGIRKGVDAHSPSRKAIAAAEDVGDGAIIGLKNKTKDVKQAGIGQAAVIIDGYREQEVAAQRALIHVADMQASRQAAGQMTAAATNGPMLERILAAIEHGHVLVLDSDAVVGGTIDKYDRELGSRLLMVKRGAR